MSYAIVGVGVGVAVEVTVGVGVGVKLEVTVIVGVGVGLVLGLLSEDKPPKTITPPSISKFLRLTLPVISKPAGLRSKTLEPIAALKRLLLIVRISTKLPAFSTDTVNSPDV